MPTLIQKVMSAYAIAPPTSGGLVASLSKWSIADGKKELPLIPDGRSKQGFASLGEWGSNSALLLQ